jgi:hypothetical protein
MRHCFNALGDVCVQSTATFWDTWKEFEIKHGNEDTVREMLRIKRSVQALFNTQVNFLAAQMMTAQAARESASQGTHELSFRRRLMELLSYKEMNKMLILRRTVVLSE